MIIKRFSVWLEERDYLSDAILGVFGGENSLGDQEKAHILQRNTNEFSNDIIREFLNLGVIKSYFDSNPNKYIDIKNMVKNGVLIKDLIDKIRGENLAPNATIQSSGRPNIQ
jgi:hypothetical protein